MSTLRFRLASIWSHETCLTIESFMPIILANELLFLSSRTVNEITKHLFPDDCFYMYQGCSRRIVCVYFAWSLCNINSFMWCMSKLSFACPNYCKLSTNVCVYNKISCAREKNVLREWQFLFTKKMSNVRHNKRYQPNFVTSRMVSILVSFKLPKSMCKSGCTFLVTFSIYVCRLAI